MIRLLAVLLSLSSLSFATNGGNVIGVGPRSLSMGGTGLAHDNGHLDGMYKNPSLLTERASGGDVNFDVAATYLGLNATGSTLAGTAESKSKGLLLPEAAFSYRINEQMTAGLGFMPYAGADFDYEGQAALVGIKVQHKVIRVQPTFAMTPAPGFSFGVSPILVLGSLSINSAGSGTQSTFPQVSGTGFSGQVGANYKMEALTFGASYILPARVKHAAVTNLDLFGPAPSAANAGGDDIELQQPGEIGVGVGFAATPEWTLTFDYRNIMWGSANIYKDLGWLSQSVFAFGTQYKIDKIALRAGFNYGNPPVENVSNENGLATTTLDGHSMLLTNASFLNAVGFPPAAKTHITVGAGYEFSPTVGADLSFVYAPKTTITRAGTGTLLGGATAAYASATEMSQFVITGGVRVGF